MLGKNRRGQTLPVSGAWCQQDPSAVHCQGCPNTDKRPLSSSSIASPSRSHCQEGRKHRIGASAKRGRSDILFRKRAGQPPAPQLPLQSKEREQSALSRLMPPVFQETRLPELLLKPQVFEAKDSSSTKASRATPTPHHETRREINLEAPPFRPWPTTITSERTLPSFDALVNAEISPTGMSNNKLRI